VGEPRIPIRSGANVPDERNDKGEEVDAGVGDKMPQCFVAQIAVGRVLRKIAVG
jgi:hypothetical protein